MLFDRRSFAVAWVLASVVAGCGGNKEEAKVPEASTETSPSREKTGPVPVVEQELGSIEQRDVERTFNGLQGKLEKCHAAGRERVDYLSGEVKVFLRLTKAGKVRYGWFEDSTLGDRDTEKCIFEVLNGADWPKPVGGEAEVRNGFGWPGGGERPPGYWTPDKVKSALDDASDVKGEIAKCKSGVPGEFRVTGYIEHDDDADAEGDKPSGTPGTKAANGPKPPKPGKPAPKGVTGNKGDKNKGGRFKSVGVAVPNKEAAEKVDCIVEALKPLRLPSPGSYAVKVGFTL